MSIITLPATLKFGVDSGVGQRRFDLLMQSDSNGSQQARLLGPPRWTLRLVQPEWLTLTEAGAWAALLMQMRGRVNVLAAWDVARPAPRGTARGSMVTSGTTAAGATFVAIAGATHRNLIRHTQDLGGASWSGAAAVTANTHVAPDGTTTADTITDGSGAALQGRGQSIAVTSDSSSYVFSVYVRKTSGATQPTFLLDCTFTGGTAVGNGVRLNTDTGAVLHGSAVVADAGSYWRVMAPLSNNSSGNTTAGLSLFPACAPYGLVSLDNSQIGSAVVWGAQIERGTVATDYAAGATLLAGDWLQVGTGLGTSQCCMVVADAIAAADGLLTAAIEPPLRTDFSSGTVVAWDKPLAYYRQQTDSSTWTYIAGGLAVSGLSLDLMETWS